MSNKTKAMEFVDTSYNIQVTGRHVQITDAIRNYVIEKVSKIDRFMDRIIDVSVILEVQKLEQRVEIILKAGNIKITSQATTTDLYASVDKAVHKLEAQVLRYKSKIQDHHAKGHAVMNMTVDVVSSQEIDEDLDSYEESGKKRGEDRFTSHQVVKQETRPLKILTYDEAVMKMELSGDSFMVFKNEEDLKLKVIYRRKDEDYGIIEPSC